MYGNFYFYGQRGGGTKTCALCKSPGTTKATCPLNPEAINPNPMKHNINLEKNIRQTQTKTFRAKKSNDELIRENQKCEFNCIKKRNPHDTYPRLYEYMPYVTGKIQWNERMEDYECQCIGCQNDRECNAFYVPTRTGGLKNKCITDKGCEITKPREPYQKTIQDPELRDFFL